MIYFVFIWYSKTSYSLNESNNSGNLRINLIHIISHLDLSKIQKLIIYIYLIKWRIQYGYVYVFGKLYQIKSYHKLVELQTVSHKPTSTKYSSLSIYIDNVCRATYSDIRREPQKLRFQNGSPGCDTCIHRVRGENSCF